MIQSQIYLSRKLLVLTNMLPIPKATEPHLLETYTPEVVRAYVSSRLESVSVVLREGLDDPLDDVTVIQQQLDQVCVC